MRNFLVTIKPDSQQLYLNAVLLNNSSLEFESFNEHKKVLFSDDVPNDIIKSIFSDPRVIDRHKNGISAVACWGHTIQICLSDIEMQYDFMNGGDDYVKRNYSSDVLSDYSIIEFNRTDFFKGINVIHGDVQIAHVKICLKNMQGDIIQFDSHNIIDFEWEKWTHFITEFSQMHRVHEERREAIERDDFGFFEDYDDKDFLI